MKNTHRICALFILTACVPAGAVHAQGSPAAVTRSNDTAAGSAAMGPRRLPAASEAALPAPRLDRAAPADRVGVKAAFLKRPPVIGALAGAALGGLFVIAVGERGNPGGFGEVAPYILMPAAAGALIGLLIQDGLSQDGP